MKKQSLLAAAAVGTLALAGAAHAGTITTATVGGFTHTTSADAYSLASELVVSGTDPVAYLKAATTSTLDVTTGNDLPAGTYLVSFKVGGTAGATFTTGATAADLTVNTSAGCLAPSKVVSSSTASEISFLVTAPASCTGATVGITNFVLNHGLEQEALGTITINGTITSGGNPVDGGTSPNFTLVDTQEGFEVAISDGTDQTADLPDFTALSGTGIIGDVVVGLSGNTTYKDGAGTLVSGADIDGTVVSITGTSFTNVDVTVGGVTPDDADVNPQVFDLGAGVQSVDVDVASAGDPDEAIRNSTYSASVAVDLDAAFNDLDVASGDLSSIVRDGANVLLPWVASGTLVGTSQGETVVRISNIGSQATGAVSAELLTSTNGAGLGNLSPIAASIPAGGELVVTSGQFQTNVFGTDFGRADINIVVEAAPDSIVIRRFVRNTVNNVLTEVSLGRDAGGNEPVN